MNERIATIQRWIKSKGVACPVDGVPGPITRGCMIEAFRNRSAPAVSPDEIRALAKRLGCTERQIKAVAKVESAGAGWDKSGLLTCLFERHYLFRRIKVAVPFLSNPTPGGYTIDADGDGINDSWEKLADATMRWPMNIALECASFGRFQVMGAHWKALGYESVIEMVYGQTRTEAAQFEVFARYIEANHLVGALRAVDGNPANCTPLARGYNGKGQKGYDGRIAQAFRMMVG